MKKILSINAGSTSFKFSLFLMPSEIQLIIGNVQNIDLPTCVLTINLLRGDERKYLLPNCKYDEAVKNSVKYMIELNIIENENEIFALGHRVVNGGEIFKNSLPFTKSMLKKLETMNDLAPLHNPVNLQCYKAFAKILPKVLHVAVFDTSFHTTMSAEDYLFPIPYEYYEKYKIRRYGAHGTSVRYVMQKYIDITKNQKPNLIVCHIGGGVSITAISKGKSIATSMGLTPTGGAMMTTRSGDLDPTVLQYMSRFSKINIEKVINILTRNSGLIGVAKLETGDFRNVENGFIKKENLYFIQAYKLFFRRLIDFIGQYYFRLNGQVDAIIFTAGIPENSKQFRKEILNALKDSLKLVIDKKNSNKMRQLVKLTTKKSGCNVYVIPTNEELIIARDTYTFAKK